MILNRKKIIRRGQNINIDRESKRVSGMTGKLKKIPFGCFG